MKRKIENSIRMALQYILKERERDYREAWSIFFWGLRDYLSFNHHFSPVIGDIFCRAIVLDTLIDLYNTGFVEKSIVTADLNYLISKKDKRGWKYYPDSNALPEDADDTGLILESLVRMKYDERYCNNIAKSLVGNILEDGAIFTWLVNPKEREKAEKRWGGGISPAVTATVAYSIYFVDPIKYKKILEKTNFWLQRKLISGKIQPVWYVSPLYAIYRITRFLKIYNNSLSDDIKEKIISLNVPDINSVLDLSYALIIQKILGINADKSFVYRILNSQRADGSFKEEYFHYYMPPNTLNINLNILKKYRPDILFYSSTTVSTTIALKTLVLIYRDIIK
ncbi:hypothetical protein DRN58_03935 [Thermococci archaeon]|nr:MAG: hypothetical protein DRN58_03935 [Thermococci archaeon]